MEVNVVAEATQRNTVGNTSVVGAVREVTNPEANAVTRQKGHRAGGRRRSANHNEDGH
ncbi:hypothetical protein PPTG_21992 [Phytophthora nicotianae INRA-310]|uniref:Uncharacterized protein n=1 Tax=Phytophthora nicotianae (strain INRA-310) TaxID=761204 RepID=W2QRH7_PHYN3|nr:hypothetical protein PPTG_21992 [Phytophthora nicotianae INRA-310]ETN15782.1 hypothetical protein PPTG_21992 [Phytophthora nicotianae INRA-310]